MPLWQAPGLPLSVWWVQPLGGDWNTIAIFGERIAKSRFIRLLTAQPIRHLECNPMTTARYSQPVNGTGVSGHFFE